MLLIDFEINQAFCLDAILALGLF